MSTSRRIPRWAWAVIAAVAVLIGVAGCAQVLGIESDRHVTIVDSGTPPPPTTDSGTDAGAPDDVATLDAASLPDNWACLADPIPPTPDGSVEVSIFFNDVSGGSTNGTQGTPIPGAEVHACNRLDFNCSNPFSEEITDDGGIANLYVPGGFAGYFEVHAPNFTPGVISRTPQLSNEAAQQGMANFSLLSAGASLAKVTQDPNLSIAIVSAADCTTTQAAGIQFQVAAPGGNELVVYLQNNYPTQGATATDAVSGSALIFNVPPGTLEITASFAATGQPIRTITTLARQNWVTFVHINPDQATHPAPP